MCIRDRYQRRVRGGVLCSDALEGLMNKCVARVSPVTRGFSFAYKSFLATCLLLATFIAAGNARAEDSRKSLIFMDNSVSLLTGTGFQVPGENISTVTFEHVSKWKWGDVFGFFDYLDLSLIHI
eukprot:TRINITY_DN4019_c0_g1_i2.p1 TRINITY_DN4019_c0_g1~~TRINITY_DN4019_c0_g1_i2.p1  ORF type:complete len:124 (-),score=12.03 TRINITY_DN4019_c0_g1_i2:172-543(-)